MKLYIALDEQDIEVGGTTAHNKDDAIKQFKSWKIKFTRVKKLSDIIKKEWLKKS